MKLTEAFIQVGISRERASELIASKFDVSSELNLRYTEFSHVYGSTAGPMGGVGGQLMTNFILQAWYEPNRGYAVVFYESKVLAVMAEGEFEVFSTYRSR